MGAFNDLAIQEANGENLTIQFKYGVRWQYTYRLGDKIEFVGEPPDGECEVDGISNTGQDFRYFAIKFAGNRIASYREIEEAEYQRLHANRLR